jgi:ferredoxin--NADP+ reductase
MNIEELELGPTRDARLVANTLLTGPDAREEVRELTLQLEDTHFRFEIGQCIAVLVAGPLDFGQRHHVRLYSIASTPDEAQPGRVSICVRRCSYLDPFSGERYPGVASNFLCDLEVGAHLVVAGPVGLPFRIPDDPRANLLMVGLGTGIGPFRALIRHIYTERGGWQGKVRLFYGARSGLELTYMNDRRTDISSYLDQDTFRAIEALSPRPAWDEPADLTAAIGKHEAEVMAMLEDPHTYIYLAGLARVGEALDGILARAHGGSERWTARKAELIDAGRWMELLY